MSKVAFYIGNEATHTNANSAKTLFIVGLKNIDLILSLVAEHKCSHVYLGTKQTFLRGERWHETASRLLKEGLKVTLEYPYEMHEYVTQTYPADVISHRNFIPVVRISIPNIQINKNLVVKIDSDRATSFNPGVWTIPVGEGLDHNRLTQWGEFDKDIPVGFEEEEKPEVKAAVKTEVNLSEMLMQEAATPVEASDRAIHKGQPKRTKK